MINSLLKRVNTLRKARYFKNELYRSRKTYAFIGLGMHSLNNLLPLLKHFNIRIKYIHTQSSSYYEAAKLLFPQTLFTNSIEDILGDKEVEGIFICASPAAHFSLLKQCLGRSKKVFIEKPPCETLHQLQELLSISSQSVCKVGLQRRHWPGNRMLKRKITKAHSYTYHFQTGSYITGGVLTELFIHPLDYIIRLFGEGEIQSSYADKNESGTILQLHFVHHNNVSGMINCSSQGSWTNPYEELLINTSREHLCIKYPVLVEGEIKPGRLLNIPAERILQQPVTKKQYYKADNFLLPVAEQNTLYLQGFYDELKTFIQLVEGTGSTNDQNDLEGLIGLYKIFEQLKKSHSNAFS